MPKMYCFLCYRKSWRKMKTLRNEDHRSKIYTIFTLKTWEPKSMHTLNHIKYIIKDNKQVIKIKFYILPLLMLTKVLRKINGWYFKTFQVCCFSFLYQYVLILWLKLIVKTVLVADYGTHKVVGKSELSPELGKWPTMSLSFLLLLFKEK